MINSIKVNGYTNRGSNPFNFACLFSRGQLLKERICSCRSKLLALRVDPMSESYITQRSKQEFMQVNITFFREDAGGVYKNRFVRAVY